MSEVIYNEMLEVAVSRHGAELCSIKKENHEFLWQADAQFWARHAPVLFPIVGKVFENQYRIGEQLFSLTQHGFARDMDFELLKQNSTSLVYSLKSDEHTLKKYPFAFELQIGYELILNSIQVTWRVINCNNHAMPFQIGAHPAFYYPSFQEQTTQRGCFLLKKNGKPVKAIEISLLNENGYLLDEKLVIPTNDGLLPITTHTFDKDALVIENEQVDEVLLMNNNRAVAVSMEFSAPVLGLWSPVRKNAPFVCIEPWYGRADAHGFTEDFYKKPWMNLLQAGETFEKSYQIAVY